MRLIDADELMEHVWRDKLDSRELIAEMINNAPTVKDIPTNIPISIFERLISQEPCSNCCDGNQIEKAKLCQKSYLAGMEHKQEQCADAISRQKVNILVDELARAISDERCCMPRGRSTGAIMQDILDLPPVNSQEQKGAIRNEVSVSDKSNP